MATPKVFMIGATGFIGATVYDLIYAKHPEYDYTALVRSKEKAEELVAHYPLTHAIVGDLNDIQLIESEAEKANIVVNTADADNVNAAKAILKGLAKRATPGFYIHTSGTGVLNDVTTGKMGQYTTTKIYDDIENLSEVVALPESQIHQEVDQMILRAPANVKTAIVSPPTIYGTGATARPRILQIPWLVDAILKRGAAFQVNQGLNSWDAVHVRDVATIYLALVEAASGGGGKATWGKEGYYFAESQNYKWTEISHAVAEIAYKKGFLSSANVDDLSIEEVAKLHPWGPLLWGSNCRSKASRARKLFGWTPEYPDVWSSIEGYVVEGARANGLLK